MNSITGEAFHTTIEVDPQITGEEPSEISGTTWDTSLDDLSDWSSDYSDNAGDKIKEEDSEKVKKTSNVRLIFKGFMLTILFYFLMGTIIDRVSDNDAGPVQVVGLESLDIDGNVNDNGNNQGSSCSANSFLLGDGVCDEVTNTQRCFWDQWDCCLENKNEKYCLDCTCKMTETKEETRLALEQQNFDIFIVPKFKWTDENLVLSTFPDVMSASVCLRLCLRLDAIFHTMNFAAVFLRDMDKFDCHCLTIGGVLCGGEEMERELFLDQTRNRKSTVDNAYIFMPYGASMNLMETDCEESLYFVGANADENIDVSLQIFFEEDQVKECVAKPNWIHLGGSISEATGSLMSGQELIVCGGVASNDQCQLEPVKSCNTESKKVIPLLQERTLSGSVEVGDFLFITGGHHSSGLTLNTSEIVDPSKRLSRRGPDLTVPTEGHCMLSLDSNSAMIMIGGRQFYTRDPNSIYVKPTLRNSPLEVELFKESWIFQPSMTSVGVRKISGGRWTKGPELSQPRHSHACVWTKFNDTDQRMALVAGGSLAGGVRTSSTEILVNGKRGTWRIGPRIPIEEGYLLHVGLASSSQSSQVYLIASTMDHSLLFKWTSCPMSLMDECHWQNMRYHLRQRRTGYLLLIPTKRIDCREEDIDILTQWTVLDNNWVLNANGTLSMEQFGEVSDDISVSPSIETCPNGSDTVGPITLKGKIVQGVQVEATGLASASSVKDLDYEKFRPELAFDNKVTYYCNYEENDNYDGYWGYFFHNGFKSASNANIDYNQWLQFHFDQCVRVFNVIVALAYSEASKEFAIHVGLEPAKWKKLSNNPICGYIFDTAGDRGNILDFVHEREHVTCQPVLVGQYLIIQNIKNAPQVMGINEVEVGFDLNTTVHLNNEEPINQATVCCYMLYFKFDGFYRKLAQTVDTRWIYNLVGSYETFLKYKYYDRLGNPKEHWKVEKGEPIMRDGAPIYWGDAANAGDKWQTGQAWMCPENVPPGSWSDEYFWHLSNRSSHHEEEFTCIYNPQILM